jgi:hypothetical protein
MHCSPSFPHGNVRRDGRLSTMANQLADLLRLNSVSAGLPDFGATRATVLRRLSRFSMVGLTPSFARPLWLRELGHSSTVRLAWAEC